jgi:hypothetical protein
LAYLDVPRRWGSRTLSVDGLQEGKRVQVQVFVYAKQELERSEGMNVEKESWPSHVGGVRRLSLNTVVCVSCQERSTLARPNIPITLYVHDYTGLGANLARASGVSVSPLGLVSSRSPFGISEACFCPTTTGYSRRPGCTVEVRTPHRETGKSGRSGRSGQSGKSGERD